MNFPSIFICNSNHNCQFPDLYENYFIDNLLITYLREYKNKLFLFDNEDFLVIAHANIACRSKLQSMGDAVCKLMLDNTPIISSLRWGFLFFLNKHIQQFKIYNDIYGIYPIFIKNNDNGFFITNDSDKLLQMQDSVYFDNRGLFDYFLFNYTINERTLFKDIYQLKGGSSISGYSFSEKIEIRIQTDIAGYLTKPNITRLDLAYAVHAISENIKSDLDNNKPVVLPLSGGFDSKLLFSVLLNNQFDFSTYTYGYQGSVDFIAAESTAKKFGISHQLFNISVDSTTVLDARIKSFINGSPSLPIILDLLSYELVKQNLSSSNIITGVMGGELMVGPVVISEVIVTRTAKRLATSKNLSSLRSGIITDIDSITFLDRKNYIKHIEEHLSGLDNYFMDPADNKHNNITRFLLNETYAKFFGVVFKNLSGNFNMINPYVDLDFLEILLNSEYRFTRNKMFTRNPIIHLKSRRLYPKMILELYKPVIYTPLDRNYNMADLLYYYRLPFTLKSYIENHLFGKNKVELSNAIQFKKIFRLLIYEKLKNSPLLDMDFIRKDKLLGLLNDIKMNNPVPAYIERKLILMLSLHYIQGLYKINTCK
jgi:hypothetical protein